jgi:hypothetical protein
MIKVVEEGNGSFTISWDEKDPVESILNTWTEQDFINTISNYLNNLEIGLTDGE